MLSLGAMFNTYLLVFVLSVILIFSLLISNKIYLIIFKDIINSMILLSIFIMMDRVIVSKKELKDLFLNLVELIIAFAAIISIFKLGEMLSIFSASGITEFNKSNTLNNNYLDQDNNIGILPVIFGVLGITYLVINNYPKSKKISLELLLVIFLVAIFFSGSRRGIIMFFLFVGALFIIQFVNIFLNIRTINFFRLRLTLLIVFTFFSITIFTIFTSYSFKNKTLKCFGSKNLCMAKENITSVLYKYYLIIDNKKTYLDLFNKIWDVRPIDPESGWGTRHYKSVFPLYGKSAEIVPRSAKGYLMDFTCEATPINGNAYSFTQIASKNVKRDEIIKASVYCFVSEDFNGEWASLSTEGTKTGESAKFYDFAKKGTWQKLDLEVKGTTGNLAVFLYFAKYGVSDFNSLKGYVIYAFPVVEVLSSYGFNSKTDIVHKSNNYTDLTSDVNSKSQNPIIHSAKYGSYPAFNFSTLSLLSDDPIRKWISKVISEDSTYYPLKSNTAVDQSWNKFGDERIIRWIFGIQIFLNEYTWEHKIFGNGFNFLNWYGYYFLKDKTLSDWPHNPFIAILLYSGIIGLTFYCLFIFMVFKYYLKYLKDYPLMFFYFIIAFFFSFFSGSSPFDPPIMGYFVILPFFIHSIHKKERKLTFNTDSIEN
jgi:hypothetical protein